MVGSASNPILSLCVVLAMGMAGVALAGEPISADEVKGPVHWGSAERVTHLRHLWFADQPDAAGFELARAAGVAVVINLRAPSELDWDEKAAVEKLGMTYYNVPVAGPRFEKSAFERIEELVSQNEDAQVLIHCASSNRVGGWLATHLVEKHGMSVEDALVVGRRAGITKQGVEDGVRAYLADHE
jgi:protein tyrosine phosphatase (PTP) superfamily phosphohydrolase (DUF442 family)